MAKIGMKWKFRDCKFSGIYKISCNGKFYIGSARCIRDRWNLHLQDLRNGRHHNQILQRTYNKYGEDAFHFEVIERCELQDLIEKEQYYIDTLKPNYNITKIAYSCLGKKCSDETKIKISNALKGKNTHLNAIEVTSRPIIQLNMNGEEISEFRSMAEAFRTLGIPQGNIHRAIRKNLTAGGYKWKYKYENN